MYNANELRRVATDARVKEELLKRCVAQHFFAEVYPEIEDSALNGEFSYELIIPRKYGFAVKEIRTVFQRFGYRWTVQERGFWMVVKIEW